MALTTTTTIARTTTVDPISLELAESMQRFTANTASLLNFVADAVVVAFIAAVGKLRPV